MANSTMLTETSPFGDKNLAACTTPIDVKVDGQIPEWVHGVLYRVGKQSVYVWKGKRITLYISHVWCHCYYALRTVILKRKLNAYSYNFDLIFCKSFITSECLKPWI